jgi:hypothetical protein
LGTTNLDIILREVDRENAETNNATAQIVSKLMNRNRKHNRPESTSEIATEGFSGRLADNSRQIT